MRVEDMAMIADNQKIAVRMLAVEGPETLFQDYGTFESLQSALAASDRMLEEETWPEGASLYAISREQVYLYDEDEGKWDEDKDDTGFRELLLRDYRPVQH